MILVTGGAGFLGSHLVAQLLDAGESVRVLERPGAKVDHLPLDRIELVSADIRDEPAVREAERVGANTFITSPPMPIFGGVTAKSLTRSTVSVPST